MEGRVEAHRSCRIRFAIKSQRSPAPVSLRFRVADTNEANRERQSHGKRAHRRNGHTVFFAFRPVDIFRSRASPSLQRLSKASFLRHADPTSISSTIPASESRACRAEISKAIGIKSLLWGFLSHKTQKSLRFLVNPASFFRTK